MSGPRQVPRYRYHVTVAPGLARRGARAMVRHQLTRPLMIVGYLLLLALLVLGIVAGSWPTVGFVALAVVVSVVLSVRRTRAIARRLVSSGLADGAELDAEYDDEALTIRGGARSGTVRYADVSRVTRLGELVHLELVRPRLASRGVRHVLPAGLVPPTVEPLFGGARIDHD